MKEESPLLSRSQNRWTWNVTEMLEKWKMFTDLFIFHLSSFQDTLLVHSKNINSWSHIATIKNPSELFLDAVKTVATNFDPMTYLVFFFIVVSSAWGNVQHIFQTVNDKLHVFINMHVVASFNSSHPIWLISTSDNNFVLPSPGLIFLNSDTPSGE